AAVLELQPVGILEVDRLGPVVVDHLGHLDALGDQLVALLFQPGLRARLECEVIEGRGHAEPASNPSVIVARHARHPAPLHEADDLVAPGMEEDVADPPALFYPDDVAAHRLESQHVLIEVAGLVEIQRRETDVGEASMRHGAPPCARVHESYHDARMLSPPDCLRPKAEVQQRVVTPDPALLVGVDVGGTFTDLVLLDEATGAVRVAKVPTTVANQADGVLAALTEAGAAPVDLKVVVHGTTTATNALLERKGASTGLITTRGFRDVLELGRRTRPTPYGLKGTFEALIPRELRVEVSERIDAEGQVVTPLAEDEVRRAAAWLRERGVEALVIHFIHSYVNDAHGRRAREVAATEWPNAYLTVGAELLPEYREFERGTTAAINGFVQPVIDRYLRRLAGELGRQGYRHELLVMQGNGGTMSVDVAARHAVNTLMSGPAAGVKAAALTAQAAGHPNLLACDMGGTSFDVGVIVGGAPAVSADKEMGYGLPVRVPMIDIHTIGAGGGSIARVSSAGILQVGPESAGAEPGPIAYGRGGQEPTIT